LAIKRGFFVTRGGGGRKKTTDQKENKETFRGQQKGGEEGSALSSVFEKREKCEVYQLTRWRKKRGFGRGGRETDWSIIQVEGGGGKKKGTIA